MTVEAFCKEMEKGEAGIFWERGGKMELERGWPDSFWTLRQHVFDGKRELYLVMEKGSFVVSGAEHFEWLAGVWRRIEESYGLLLEAMRPCEE